MCNHKTTVRNVNANNLSTLCPACALQVAGYLLEVSLVNYVGAQEGGHERLLDEAKHISKILMKFAKGKEGAELLQQCKAAYAQREKDQGVPVH